MNAIHKRAKRGFTLLEILLVIAAIGILAAIVLIAINPNRQLSQARNAQRRADVNTLYKALEQYLINTSSYPEGIDNIPRDICINGNTINCVNLEEGILVPIYLTFIPVDPTGGAYKVSINSDNNRISVTAPSAELGQGIAINSPPPTPEELIQAQITAGTLVPTGTQQLVLNRLVYKNNAGTQTYIDPATTTKICPTGYIPVPGNSMYGTSDFCVMKYEAKAVAISDPTLGLLTPTPIGGSGTIANNVTATTSANGRMIASVASGYPIATISQPLAVSYCTTAGGSLISNAEWMTIARNIEGVASNWTNNEVGNGGLWRGHSDSIPNSALVASTDNDPYNGTGNVSPSIERRTHTLSNGEVIWDLSGNIWEWTNDTILGKDQPTGSSTGFDWREYTSITNYGTLSYDLTRPSNNTWNSVQNMGKINSDGTSTNNTRFALRRGGRWSTLDNTGVFSMYLNYTPSSSVNDVGFRCVLR